MDCCRMYTGGMNQQRHWEDGLTWFCPRVAGKVSNPAAMIGDDGCMHAMLLVWPEVHLHHCIGVHLEGSTIGQGVCFVDLCHHPVQQMHSSLSELCRSLPCYVELVIVEFFQDSTFCFVRSLKTTIGTCVLSLSNVTAQCIHVLQMHQLQAC